MMKSLQPTTQKRRGVTTVEFAIVAPILFLMVFAGFEFSRANLLVNTAHIAAVEGARRGIIPGATASECIQAAQDELDIIGVKVSNVTVSPNPLTRDDTEVTVNVSVPMTGQNGFAVPRFFLGKTLQTNATLLRETPSFN